MYVRYLESFHSINRSKARQLSRASHRKLNCTLSKNGRKFREAFVYIFFQASWAKIFDLLRVIAVNGTITIEFYVEF